MATLLFVAFAYSIIWKQLAYNSLPLPNEPYYFQVESGTSLIQLTHQLAKAGVLKHPSLVRWYAVGMGYANNLKAGEYKIMPHTSAAELLSMVVNGEVAKYAITIVEGLRTADLLAALELNPKIQHNLIGLSDQAIINKLAIPVNHLEGIFLPDTYYFTAGTSDIDFLRRAYNSMQDKLKAAWDKRAANIMVKTPYEALILASIIEKESGVFDEYQQISGVYQRRLAKGMRLQADPTLVYFLGDKLQGQLRHKHLKIDSPYNTYTRHGLPPTPIALPSISAIEAAMHPAAGDTLYFVATGTGGHVFSRTLEEHVNAIKKFRS